GKIAKTGEISSRLLLLLIKNSQLLVNSISTGKEVYGEKLSKQILDYSKQLNLKNQDILASVGEFTAQMIAKKLIPLLKSDENLLKLYLTGGGRKNKFLIDRIEINLKGIKVEPIEKIGLCGDSIEAVSYAIMGEASIRSEPMKTVFIKGKKQKILPVLGEIVQPPVVIQPSVVM
ncbi:MAG: anhydro-N-acetylmuramic acid kinase, partial [candidate division Zixibacteria bacterium]|nr:anhydro-N-acetylmuramic acid kinase [candidate division Zixibacteria bacterium]